MNDELNLLREENASLKKRIEELEAHRAAHSSQEVVSRPASEAPADIAPLQEADATLRRMVQRIAMILQAQKIVIMFYDKEMGDLKAIPPAVGVDEDIIRRFKVRATQGLSGEVFRSGTPLIFHDAGTDERTAEDHFTIMGVTNGITVPLVIEKRDEENRVIDRTTIGVLHAFNKGHGEDFIDEDVRLLTRMALNVGSIIANLQLYRELVEDKEELLQTLESISSGLVLVSTDGRISQMNSSARTIFGLTANPVGRPYYELMTQANLGEMIETAQKGGDAGSIELEVTLKNTTYTYKVNGAQVKYEDGKDLGVVLIMTDFTEIKNIEKMKSSFVAMASHELRTPLTAIKGFSSTLLDGIDDDMFTVEEQKEFLGIVVGECDRLRRLIDDLLNTSRIEAGESLKPSYSEFDLVELLEKAVRVQQQSTNKHTLKLNITPPLPASITGDRDKVDQILTNFMNNAIKYAPNGGDVTIHAFVEGDYIKIGVQDQGMGIPKDHLGKVFEKFHRVDNDDNRKIYGTGLGLFLVKHLVEQVHMGQCWAESEVGVGSTFWFTLPVKLDTALAEELMGD
jgi:two-component system phosphate regulon sensor histidine kinase PhoR